jgi:hypothetical protein
MGRFKTRSSERRERMMRILAQFTGTVRDFRRWLAKQNRQVQIIDLAEYREKKKTASAKAAREKKC